MVYFMLSRGEAFVDQGRQRYEEQQLQRSIPAMERRAVSPGLPDHANAIGSVMGDGFRTVSCEAPFVGAA